MEPDRNILSLIAKLNDRNLQMHRESGITVYALLTALVLIFFRLTAIAPELFVTDILSAAHIFLITSSLFLGLATIVAMYLETADYKNPVRLLYSDLETNSVLELVVFSILFLFPLACSSYITYVNWIGISSQWYIVTCDILYALLFILIVVGFSIIIKDQGKYKLKKLYKTGKKYKESHPFVILFYFFGFCLITITTIYAFQLTTKLAGAKISSSIEFAGLIMSIPILINYIILQKNTNLRKKALENLEIEAYMYKLSDEDIKKKLQEIYLGIGFLDWIKDKEKNIETLLDDVEAELEQIEKFIEESSSVDKTKYPREYQGRLQEALERCGAIRSKVLKFMDKENIELRSINKGAFSDLSKEEYEAYVAYYDESKSGINECIKAIDELVDEIKKKKTSR